MQIRPITRQLKVDRDYNKRCLESLFSVQFIYNYNIDNDDNCYESNNNNINNNKNNNNHHHNKNKYNKNTNSYNKKIDSYAKNYKYDV